MQPAPWDVSPALTETRLRLLAETVDRVRSDALLDHDPEKGDNEWVFGCKAYARTCFAFSQLAALPANDIWLVVDYDGMACTLRVGGVLIKFYRGESDAPSARALRGLDAAVHAAMVGQGNLFPSNDNADEWGWLMAIETHSDGTVSRVVMLQATASGDHRNDWTVPHQTTTPTLVDVTNIRREGVELPPLFVGPKETGVRAKEAGAKEDEAKESKENEASKQATGESDVVDRET